jgi:hypothetical protein
MHESRVASVLVVHEDVAADADEGQAERLARLAVDSGSFAMIDAEQRWEEEPRRRILARRDPVQVWPFGLAAESGWGDGIYPLFVRRDQREVVWLLMSFDPEYAEVTK